MQKLLLSISQSSEFERLTDMVRIVDYLSILNVEKEGQFININTPEQLNNLDPSSIEISLHDKIIRIEPKYFRKFGSSCESFKKELQSWEVPEIIPHIKNNILKDAKIVLGELYEECDLEQIFH